MPSDKKPAPKQHIPVFDYRGSKFGHEVSPSAIHGQPKCRIDGKGGCIALNATPMMKQHGLHGGVWKDNGMIVYH
jgi:hypothetical protein